MFEFIILQVTCRFNFHSIHNDALVSIINAYYEYFYYTTLKLLTPQKAQFRYHFIWKQSSTKYIALGKSPQKKKKERKKERKSRDKFDDNFLLSRIKKWA